MPSPSRAAEEPAGMSPQFVMRKNKKQLTPPPGCQAKMFFPKVHKAFANSNMTKAGQWPQNKTAGRPSTIDEMLRIVMLEEVRRCWSKWCSARLERWKNALDENQTLNVPNFPWFDRTGIQVENSVQKNQLVGNDRL